MNKIERVRVLLKNEALEHTECQETLIAAQAKLQRLSQDLETVKGEREQLRNAAQRVATRLRAQTRWGLPARCDWLDTQADELESALLRERPQ
jgi:chromosome segregation ATPase